MGIPTIEVEFRECNECRDGVQTDRQIEGGCQMMKIETLPLGSLRPYARNARTHSKRQIKQIARSIERFGFDNPILIDDDKQIIAGHGRTEAAKLIGMTIVPTVRLSHLS